LKRLTSFALFVLLGLGLLAPTVAHAGQKSPKQQAKQYNDYVKHQNKMQKKQTKDQNRQTKQWMKQHSHQTTTTTVT